MQQGLEVDPRTRQPLVLGLNKVVQGLGLDHQILPILDKDLNKILVGLEGTHRPNQI